MNISIANSEAYAWGDNCKGWHLVNTTALSVIQELMPPGTQEQGHSHSKSQQFFFILKGEAKMQIGGKTAIIRSNEGVHVPPGAMHQISNQTEENLTFLVISQPHAHGDKSLAE